MTFFTRPRLPAVSPSVLNPTAVRIRRRKGSGNIGRTLYLEFLESRELLSGSPPVVSDINVNVAQNANAHFTLSQFTAAYSDIDSDTLQEIQVTALPTHGVLYYINGLAGPAAVTLNQIFNASDINNSLFYHSATGFVGDDPFSWNAFDGTSFADTSASVHVTVQNIPPTVSTITKVAPHDTPLAFSPADFSGAFADADSETIAQIQFTSLPTHGTLLFDGGSGPVAVTVNQIINASSAANLSYDPDAAYFGDDSFQWTASDGHDFAATPATLNLTIGNVPPTVANVTKTVVKNTTTAFAAADFSVGFDDDDPGDSMQAIKITSLPSNGTLKLNSVDVAVNQVISADQILHLTYTGGTGFSGADTFSYSASDGTVFAATSANVAITVTNTAPTVASFTYALGDIYNKSATFNPTMFNILFTDADAGDTLQKIRFTALPQFGTIKLSGNPVTNFQDIPVSQISKLTYTPNKNFAGTDTFAWIGSDGVSFSSASATGAISVGGITSTGVAPTVSAIAYALPQGNTITFAPTDFLGSFKDSTLGSRLVAIKFTKLPTHGVITLNGVPIAANQEFSLAQVSNLVYTPAAGFLGADSFSWNGFDNARYASTAASIKITTFAAASVTVSSGRFINNGDTTTFRFNSTDFGGLNFVTIPGPSRLTGDAHFGISINSGTVANVTVTKASTDENIALGDLAADINSALAAASLDTQIQAQVDGSTIVLVAIGGGITSVHLTTTAADPAATDIGFSSAQDAVNEGGILKIRAGQSDIRTYTIKNNTASAIDFTGVGPLIQISGTNAADFTAIGPVDGAGAPITTLAPGASATFTIKFAPKASGTRSATVKIPLSTSATPFTFKIVGTGLKTTNYNSTTSSLLGFQTITTQAGTGTGAKLGDSISMDYTGYLLDGTRFDSSLNPGHSPLSFVLGTHSVIEGWDQGLVGIKVGEKRTLIIPASLAYGPGGNSSIPANATLIFEVTCTNIALSRSGTAPAPTTLSLNFANPQDADIALSPVDFEFDFVEPSIGPGLSTIQFTTLPLHGTLVFNGSSGPVLISQYQEIPLNQISNLVYTPDAGFVGTDTFAWRGSDGLHYSAAPAAVNFTMFANASLTLLSGQYILNGSVNLDRFNSTDFGGVGLATQIPVVARLSGDAHFGISINGGAETDITVTKASTDRNIGASELVDDINDALTNASLNTLVQAQAIADGNSSIRMQLVAIDSSVTSLHFSTTGADPSFTNLRFNTSQDATTSSGSLTVSAIADLSSTPVNLPEDPDIRTYTIDNETGTAIDFTGGAQLIQITGANAADFTVSAPIDPTLHTPITSLAPGASAIFTITFVPKAAGKRTATVNIPLSNSNTPFNFKIGGTGLKTSNFSNVTTNIFGLQLAITQAGAGTASAAGDVLTLEYTAYKADGTFIDSSFNPGRGPIQYSLNSGTAPTALDPALTGIRIGDKVTIIAPSYLAAGALNQVTMPSDSTIIFEVQCIAIGVPRVGVQADGSNTLIEPGSAASVAQGTIFGPLDFSQNSLTKTFSLFSVGYVDSTGTVSAGLFFADAVNTVFLAPNSSPDFTLSHATNSGTFTITLNRPATLGTKTATVVVLTNDPIHPTLTFKISGSKAPFVDLSASIATSPAFTSTTIISGDRKTVTVPVVIKNLGNTPTKGSTEIQIFAEDTTTHVQTDITTFVKSISGIPFNGTKKINLSVTLPLGFSAGTYTLGARINTTGTILPESNPSNNTALSVQTIHVVQGLADLTGTIVSSAFNPSVVNNDSISSSMVVQVINNGNVILPANQQIQLQIIAHDIDSNANFPLTTTGNLSAASIKAGGTKNYTVTIKNSDGLPEGHYVLEAQIIPVQAIAQSSTSNDLITQNASGQTFSLLSADSFVNLTGTLVSSTLPSSRAQGAKIAGTVNVSVRNIGNMPLPTGQQVMIEIIAHSAGGDMSLKTSSALTLGALGAGKLKTLAVSVNFLDGLAAGSYTIEANIIPVQTLAETESSDNLATLKANGLTIPLTIT